MAFLGYSLHNIAQAGQKIGLARRAKARRGGVVIWLVATAGTSVSFMIILAAISIGSISLVGAMAGTGLVSLAVFSRFVMRERIETREIISLMVIVAGAAIVGALADESKFPGPGTESVELLWGILGAGSIVYSITWIATRRKPYTGAIVGGFAGFLGAYSQLFQEYGTETTPISAGLGTFAMSVISNPITLVWAGLSVVSMIVLQFSYRHGRAIEIIPSFVGNFIVVPVLGGVLIFGQSLLVVQWIGVVMITAGSIMIGRGQMHVSSMSRSTVETRRTETASRNP